jgi:hypothetical protein
MSEIIAHWGQSGQTKKKAEIERKVSLPVFDGRLDKANVELGLP